MADVGLLAQAAAELGSSAALKGGIAVVGLSFTVAAYYLKGAADSLRKMEAGWGVVVTRVEHLDGRTNKLEAGAQRREDRLGHVERKVDVHEARIASIADMQKRQDENIHDARDVANEAVLAVANLKRKGV